MTTPTPDIAAGEGLPDADYVSADGTVRLYRGDCLELLPRMERGSVSLVCTDPPYRGVKDDDWDNQWDTDTDFLAWVSQVCGLVDDILTPNGSLYWFASPQMSDLVSVEIRKTFNVLNNICWTKGVERCGNAGSGIDVTALRKFWSSSSERVIFAERYGSDKPFGDALIDGNRTYWSACKKTKRSIFGDYLRDEFDRAGVTQRCIAALFPSASGGLTGCVSNWLLGYNCPTPAQYEAMRGLLNASCNGDGPQYLRREYEDLRREYEDLRRPFTVTARDEWADVWRFPIQRNQVHPTQKPLSMMSHIITASSRKDGVVADPFMGSGTTGVACVRLGRAFIGIELEPKYFDLSVKRIEQAFADQALFTQAEAKPQQQEMFNA